MNNQYSLLEWIDLICFNSERYNFEAVSKGYGLQFRRSTVRMASCQ